MKKILIGLFLLLPFILISGGPYDHVKEKLELKYSVLTDCKINSLNIDNIDIVKLNNRIYLNMKIESSSGEESWKDFNKTSYDKIAKDIADEVREVLDIKYLIEITLILEKEVGKNKILYSKNY